MADAPPRRAAAFDFDGTLVDSLESVLAAYNTVAGTRGFPAIDHARLHGLRKLSPQRALAELEIPLWKLPALMRDVRTALRAHVHELALFPGIRELLDALHGRAIPLYIVSSNSRENVEQFAARHGLPPFEGYRCGVSLLGKAAQLRKLLKSERLDPARTFYVGDELRDVLAAKEVGMRSVAVRWGYGEPEVLAACGPDFMVSSAEELLSILTAESDAQRVTPSTR